MIGDDTAGDYFAVGATSGQITVKQTLDRDVLEKYRVRNNNAIVYMFPRSLWINYIIIYFPDISQEPHEYLP